MHRSALSRTLINLPGILLLLAALAVPAATAEPETPIRVPVLAGAAPADAPAIRVLEQNDQGVRLEFELPAIEVQSIEVGGESFDVLAIEGGEYEGAVGAPMLPTFGRLIQIPADAGVTFEATVLESRELSGYRPMPVQPDEPGAFAIDRAAYARAGYGEAPRVRLGDPAVARDVRVVPVSFAPVRYDGSRGTLEVAGRIEVRVRFAGVDLRNALTRQAAVVPESFDRLYRELVVNYRGPQEGQIVGRGAYVLICQDNATVISHLQRLVDWRKRKGYEVHLATTAETGTSATSIKAWLQNAYSTWPNPPEYITLVGDVSGTVAIPCHYEGYSGWGAGTDHPYTQLLGTDILADAHIGRISVDSTDRLALYVEKIVSYESTPYMDDVGWYTRGCVVGDPSHSGYTCIQIHQWMKERLRQIGYTEVDTVWSGDFRAQMVSHLNRGDTVFSYRGYIGMSGFGTGDISALTNGRKMPYAVNLTCDTGTFYSGTSRSEAWIRAGVAPGTPTGGIASIGTATSGTDTRHNNCMTAGIWRGALWDELYQFGANFTRGKYELYVNYAQMDYTEMCTFTCWNNLMGDAAGELWTGVPRPLDVTAPASVPVGANAITVSVTDGGSPCAGAYVCLWKGLETFIGGYTDASGAIELPVQATTPGPIKLTVTKHDCHPVLRDIPVTQAAVFVAYVAHVVDDDASGTSSGNGDGAASPTERIELRVQVRNFGTQAAGSVTGTLSSNDPYVGIPDASETFGDIAAGASAWSGDDFDIQIAGSAPNGHTIYLDLDVACGGDVWRSLLAVPVVSADLVYDSMNLYGFGPQIDPGESGELSVRIRNDGDLIANGVTATLSSISPWVIVTDETGTFGTLGIKGEAENTVDRFGLSVLPACLPGHIAPLRLVTQFNGAAFDTAMLAVVVGTVDANDPTGPDAYGYYAFDNTDTGYEEAPVYAWIEIDPTRGGNGTSVGLTDYGDGQDDSATLSLPFTFRYYGQDFTRVTICSNGWIAMGSTYLTEYRNWTIPGAEAPANMIAPMWDDLYQSGNNKVYRYADAINHRFIVQWSRMINNNGGGTENFEVILYDPAYYPTATGDGIVVFQYDQFANTDWQQHYCTVGIENEDRDDGVLYSYYNLYGPGASTVQSGRAIKFTTVAMGDPAAAPDAGAVPARLALSPCRPNPMGARADGTTLRLDLPRAMPVRLGVYDVDGRLVRTLKDGRLEAGHHTLAWDGADAAGTAQESGIYFVVLHAEGEQITRRVLRVR